MRTIQKCKEILEYLGGERDEAPSGMHPVFRSPLARCVCWIILLLLIYAFCGQTSKFIYIDF
jgi:hypothetical protein